MARMDAESDTWRERNSCGLMRENRSYESRQSWRAISVGSMSIKRASRTLGMMEVGPFWMACGTSFLKLSSDDCRCVRLHTAASQHHPHTHSLHAHPAPHLRASRPGAAARWRTSG